MSEQANSNQSGDGSDRSLCAGEAVAAMNILMTKLKLDNKPVAEATSWLVKVMNLGMEEPGFISSEIIPPYPPEQPEWVLMQNFRSNEQACACRQSQERQRLMQELSSAMNKKKEELVLEELTNSAKGSVATAIITNVRQGREREYREWEAKMQVKQAKYPGYRGSYVQPPSSELHTKWTTVLRFDTPETLDNWFHSSEREELLNEAGDLVSSTDFKPLTVAATGWYPVDAGTGKPPAVWKTALLVVLGLFPIVMLEIKYLNPLLTPLPSAALANFIGNILSVGLTSFFTIPASINAFSWWIFPDNPEARLITDIKGLAILALLFALEIALFWNLL